MVLSTLDWFALIVAVFVVVKILVILIDAKTWLKFSKSLMKNSMAVGVVSFILAIVVLYFLIQDLTIIEIFAVMLFVMLLTMATIAPYSKDWLTLAEKTLKNHILHRYWIHVIVWLILVAWVFMKLFF